MTVEISADATALAQDVASRFVAQLTSLQRAGHRPSVVLTGGTIAADMYAAIEGTGVDWANIDFYWGDERFVPDGHPDRNDRAAKEAFLNRLAVPATGIHSMPAHDCSLSTAEAADSYAQVLPEARFDLVLLGMGPDGHIASLFPGFTQLQETERRVVEVLDSPKPPSVRLTMTLPTLNHADSVWLLVSGAAKAAAVATALADTAELPAGQVTGRNETVWMLDKPAARLIGA